MLLELHVKNLALIEKADVEFGEGLNILTGETGAGKSIIIGSVTMALGGKASKDVIRCGADHAYIELIFSVDSKEKKKALMQLGTEPTEEGMVIISRKIMPSRSVSRINDETVTMARLRQITGLLLDIHGQHEHQSLLYKSKHLEILDAYVKAQTQPVRPLMEVASGGELSRIMLAIKTVLADSDDIPTLIFDEIDTGISGRTAQKVSEKLSYIAKSHQVICITHLPQIAAMADTHFEIHKAASEGSTATSIRRLNREQTVEELARLLGGAKITDTVIQNAREMKELADKTK